jgi:hypothetical protein
MPFAILLIGALLVVVAFNNSMSALASELEADVPGYFKWAAAIAAIVGLGYIPGFRTPSRYLLGLVLLVILLSNNSQIIAGFQSFFASSGTASSVGAGAANPSTAYATNPTTTSAPTAAQIAGSGSGSTATASTTGAQVAGAASSVSSILSNPLNPQSYVTAASKLGGLFA